MRRYSRSTCERTSEQLDLFVDYSRRSPRMTVIAPEQASFFPASMAAEARTEQFQRLLNEEAWQRFKKDLSAWIFFGETGPTASAMRMGQFGLARARQRYLAISRPWARD